MKKRNVISLVFIFVLVMFSFSLSLYSKSVYPRFTGAGVTASVGIFIEAARFINITSPLNTTYNFDASDEFILDLNVTSNFIPDNWLFSLHSYQFSTIVNDSSSFTPNTTFVAERGSNLLTVHANVSDQLFNQSVVFYVNVSDSSPILDGINSSIYVCEDENLNYPFNITNLDNDELTLDITPKNPFFVDPPLFVSGIYVNASIISGILTKPYVGTYSEMIYVSDGTYTDSVYTNITVIEINHAPDIQIIGVQTIYTRGDNNTLYKQIQVNDEEDGDSDSSNFVFNLNFYDNETLFNISDDGWINFTANTSQVGVYNIGVCVTDSGLSDPHEQISLCNQTGGSLTTCQNFSLTITDENRPPTITSHYPTNSSLSGTNDLYFNISKYDPDGTIPDSYWYVGNSLKQYSSGNSTDEFTYSFGCGVSGFYNIGVNITDGLLNDSYNWEVRVNEIVCPVESPSSGGGGGGGTGPSCTPLWVCGSWNVCQLSEKGLEVGILSGEDYRDVKEKCDVFGWGSGYCGFQIRNCVDLNSCNTTIKKPEQFQECFYVEEPSCHDGVKNCHDGDCELLVDCGGPCDACPTCSDGIQNQGEEGIDCGGPCPWKCDLEQPLLRRGSTLWILLILLMILIIIIIIKIKKIKEYWYRIKYRSENI